MADFLGREKELKMLRDYDHQPGSHFIVLKGRRRIGKSRLIKEFATKKALFKFTGLAPEPNITAQDQRNEFSRLLKVYFPNLPTMKADDWAELFSVLASNLPRKSCIVFFDEISWMAQNDATFLPKLKNAWDDELSPHSNLMLILCGSISLWIEKNILSSTSFIGRINHTITLRELSITESCQLLTEQHSYISAHDQFKYLSISGGVPYYLENFDASKPIEANLKRLCYTEGGLLLNEFDRIFHDLFARRSRIYKDIVLTIIKKSLNTLEIAKKLGVDQNGDISNYLKDLTEAGFISRDYSWNLKSKQLSKISRYRLSDNYLRFYLRYLTKHKHKIEQGHYQNLAMASLPEYSAMMGLQFENLVLNNREAIYQHLPISRDDIVMDGAFYQTTTKRRAGCQIDLLIQTRFNALFVCEIKFGRGEIKSDIIQEVEEKIKRLEIPTGMSCYPVLIHVNGVSDAVLDCDYFAAVIDFSELVSAKDFVA